MRATCPRTGQLLRSSLLALATVFAAGNTAGGDVADLEAKIGSRVEEFSAIRQVEARDGFVILDAPSERAQVLKRVEEGGVVNAKARTIRDGRAYYLSDWSWERFIDEDVVPNWVRIEGESVATVEAERIIRDGSGALVSLRYVTLRGHALPLLLNRDPILNNFIGAKGNVHLVENEALEALVDLAKRFPVTLRPGFSYDDQNGNFEDPSKTKTQISGTYEVFEFGFLPEDDVPVERRRGGLVPDLKRLMKDAGIVFWPSRFDEDDPKVELDSNLREGIVNGEMIGIQGHLAPDLFLEFLRAESLRKDFHFYDTTRPFYEFLLKSEVPPDFFEMSITFVGCGSRWIARVQPRNLSLKVLILENVSEREIEFEELVVKREEAVPLGPALDRAGMLTERVGDLPVASIGPGEQLIIPMHMSFPILLPRERLLSRTHHDEDISAIELDLGRVREIVSPHGEIEFWTSGMNDSDQREKPDFTLPREDFLRLCAQRPRSSERDYFYGPVVLPDSARIGGVVHALSEFEPDSILVVANYEAGSCPTIYAVDRWQQRRYAGHFLTGRDSPEKEGYYRIPLKDFGGVIDLVEEDAETSHVRWLRLRCRDKEGRDTFFDPDHPSLVRGTPEALSFDQGDRLRIRFPRFDPENAPTKVWLEGAGFYVPYEGVGQSRP